MRLPVPAPIRRFYRTHVRPIPREHLAADFFEQVYGDMSADQVDDLVERYWTGYRHLGALLETTGLHRADPDLHLLDVGGGWSTALRLFTTRFGWVLDPCVDSLVDHGFDLDRRFSWIRGGSERIPFPDRFFHAVICSNVLDHVHDPERTLDEVRRVLRPDGHFLLTVDLFHDPEAHAHHHRDVLHPHSLTADTLDRMLDARFETTFHDTQPGPGKVGAHMLVSGRIEPHLDRQEHVFALVPR